MEKVRIQDDLYQAVNGQWLQQAVIPDDRPTTGGFSLLDQNVEKTLMDDFGNFAKGTKTTDVETMDQAIKLYKKCAKRGHADSMECLAFIYQDCPGFQNKKKMFKWYLKGAESGNLTCMHNVGVCYQDGAGVKMSYTKAQFWFDKEEQANNG